ncbi:DNA repair protein RAD51-like protein 4 [Trichoplax sp. H2]|nr:DNA repair protein RAD51-like protein 4 [Trichoplax sp. H2]|eukprot:RDD46518.1 DNA repair protein RAD51-like protein 4 [Trichoplax sp. H2]
MAKLRVGMINGLNQSVIDACHKISVSTVTDFISAKVEVIARQASISITEVSSMRRKLLSKYALMPINGSHLYQMLIDKMAVITTDLTGINNATFLIQLCSLDHLLDGGLYTGEVVEFIGKSGSGKSQICMHIAGFSASTTSNGTIYIDTCGSIQPSRINEIVKEHFSHNSMENHDALSRLLCVRVHDIFELISTLQGLQEKLNFECSGIYGKLRLLIIDSIASVITPVLTIPNNHGHSLMTSLARILRVLAVECGICVLVTNFTVTGGNAALGRTWSSVPDVRVSIRTIESFKTTKGNERIATLVKSSRQPTQISTNFYIGDGGLLSTAPCSSKSLLK